MTITAGASACLIFAVMLTVLLSVLLTKKDNYYEEPVPEIVTEERVKGEVSFRVTKLGDIAHLEMNGEKRSTAGLFPECFTGIDSTDPAVNGTLGTEDVF